MWSSLEGLVVGGRYELGEHIATGGMAVVFKGWDHRVQRPVAIKMLRQLELADTTAVWRFQREAHAVAVLNHPNVVRAYDFFEEDGCAYLIMEFVDGINLKQQIRRHGPMRPAEALRVAEQVCAALEAAHAQCFIHRDIKPQNILLDRSGDIKVADFGIVHITRGSTLTSDGTVLGTADYIAPEQARGETLTAATDVYALGVVLYEMLTGQLPFTGSTPMAVATLHATEPIPPPSCVVPTISPYVEAVVLRALHKQPWRRYQSASAFALALRLARETVCATRVDDAHARAAESCRPSTSPDLSTRVAVPVLAGATAGATASATTGRGDAALALLAPVAATREGAAAQPTMEPAHASVVAAVATTDTESPAEPSENWRDVAAILLGNAPSAPGEEPRDSQRDVAMREWVNVPSVMAAETAARASWLRLVFVALTSLALLVATLGLELWLNLHAAGMGGLPLP